MFTHVDYCMAILAYSSSICFSGKARNETPAGGRFVVFAISAKMGHVPGHMSHMAKMVREIDRW